MQLFWRWRWLWRGDRDCGDTLWLGHRGGGPRAGWPRDRPTESGNCVSWCTPTHTTYSNEVSTCPWCRCHLPWGRFYIVSSIILCLHTSIFAAGVQIGLNALVIRLSSSLLYRSHTLTQANAWQLWPLLGVYLPNHAHQPTLRYPMSSL